MRDGSVSICSNC